jgi:tetrapyrrole methylase family protein/MazG family protein
METLMDFSLVASAFETLRLSPPSKLTLLEAQTLSSAHVPPFPPDTASLLIGFDSLELALHVIDVLLAVYPKEHVVFLIKPQNDSVTLPLADLANEKSFDSSTCLYVPALVEGTAFEAFQEIVAHLRAPNGCPWDREQTHESLRKHLLEESYEAIAAIDSGNFDSMREEFGDLLLQIMLHSQIANEEGKFTANDVVKGIYDKIIRRHPHVFGDVEIGGVDGVLQNWEKLKQAEREEKREKGEGEKVKGMLDGVPIALPALSQAQEYQDRAARVGFDWPVIDEVLDKLIEEAQEVKNAETNFELADEIGDLFFVLVNFARWKKVDAESALRRTNMKFKKRFGYIETNAKKQERSLSDMKLEEMDALWNEAKKLS